MSYEGFEVPTEVQKPGVPEKTGWLDSSTSGFEDVACSALNSGKQVTEQVLGGFWAGIARLGVHFTLFKYGPLNYFRRNDPDYRMILDKWDKFYEENSRPYAVLPDWPFIRQIQRIKTAWHQMKFMQYENYHVSHMLHYSEFKDGSTYTQPIRAFIPTETPISLFFFAWDDSDIKHPQGPVHNAEIHLQHRNTEEHSLGINDHKTGNIDRRQRFYWNQQQSQMHNTGAFMNTIVNIRPKILKTEDFGWHANGLFYPLEGSRFIRPETPIFANQEQERKFLGRWNSYKETMFGKKYHGSKPYNADWMHGRGGIYDDKDSVKWHVEGH